MSKFKVGDSVRYVEDQDYSFITIGRVYEVLKLMKDDRIVVTDDDGDEGAYEDSIFELVQDTPVNLTEKLPLISDKPVISDGLSTSYYQLTITNEAGDSIQCEMGDVIRCVVGDNFSLGNVLKAARRMYEASQGRGKKDVSMSYDANKIAYFSKEFTKFYENKQ